MPMTVISISVGRPQIVIHEGRQYSTSINRTPVDGPVALTDRGFVGDRVADSERHGSPDQAVCCYPHEHYALWADQLGRAPDIPAVGENLTTTGMLEHEVCIGDTYRVGKALLQVSQPRGPCWKLANKHDAPQLVRWIKETRFSGFYFRVLEPAEISAGDPIELVSQINPGQTVAAALQAPPSARGSEAPEEG
ncbi:MAG: MOSC domain-containing protein [bacterium]|nr:MOSC domain-containing protein [bacterium]